ncbi:unnamed protein product [Rodentolepis nana]|uniref:mitogen-activated protein kinase kinase n=1 Tax=Rodentolepis nana TaxID=102285 RepID=A0A0R3TEM9_RODNA|nr:unnamed protein product [Rodentolepis nana]
MSYQVYVLDCQQKLWPEYGVAFITKCVVKGLEFLRKQGIQHRDVKPSNMLVNRLGCVKICDYGVSKRMMNGITKTKQVGTYSYMAPERRTSDSENGGFRIQSDVWSLGLSVFHLSTGTFPFADFLSARAIEGIYQMEENFFYREDRRFTSEQSEFLTACLKTNELDRPDYKTLLQMDFLTGVKIKNLRGDFAKFIRDTLGP